MNMLDYFIQSQVILLVFYLVYIKLLHKKIAFGFSRVYLLSMAPVSVILPLLNIPIGAESYQSFASFLPELFVITSGKSGISHIFTVSDSGINLRELLIYCFGFVYFMGGIFLLFKFGVKVQKSLAVFKRAKKGTVAGKEIIISPDSTGAFSLFGRIIIGEHSLNNPGISYIIRHEEFHNLFFHTADLIIIFIQKIFLWFNPLMWYSETLLREVHEFQVDEQIIRLGVNPKEYLGLLLNFEMGVVEPYMANRFSYLSLKNRIIMMADVKKVKSNIRILLIVPIILLFILLFCITPAGYSNVDEDIVVTENVSSEAALLPFAICPIKPKFMGGDQNNFTRWIFNQIQYPRDAMTAGIQGRVTLQFTVNEKGKVLDVNVLKGINESLDKESLRVISSSPDWEPGKDEKGNPVKVRFTFPIIFQLR